MNPAWAIPVFIVGLVIAIVGIVRQQRSPNRHSGASRSTEGDSGSWIDSGGALGGDSGGHCGGGDSGGGDCGGDGGGD